ncbi:hypothetical protein HHE06_03870 [Helicobacter heilmannii]|uniref:hypothetical protein n=1 Tax=Helicobacter heilmannii TaxID=35817 RepID=UPI0006A06B3E|nr:hypothetical protein [Helicobacter heilmannii]CRF50550.1 hypothetical protein HHE06_03870 [Helicobacter heilmannii]
MTAKSNPQPNSETQPTGEYSVIPTKQPTPPAKVSAGKKTPKPLDSMSARELGDLVSRLGKQISKAKTERDKASHLLEVANAKLAGLKEKRVQASQMIIKKQVEEK